MPPEAFTVALGGVFIACLDDLSQFAN